MEVASANFTRPSLFTRELRNCINDSIAMIVDKLINILVKQRNAIVRTGMIKPSKPLIECGKPRGY